MYQPLLMNKTIFEKLNKNQQKAIMDGAKKAEAYYLAEAKEDQASVNVFKKNGVQIKEMSADEFNAWREIAKETSYKSLFQVIKMVKDYWI